MNKETKFIKTDEIIYRDDFNGKFHIRLLSEDVIMFTDLNKEEARKLRDFISNVILKDE